MCFPLDLFFSLFCFLFTPFAFFPLSGTCLIPSGRRGKGWVASSRFARARTEGYGKWVWESAQSLAGDQDKQMTDGTRGSAAEQGWAAPAWLGARPNPARGTPAHFGGCSARCGGCIPWDRPTIHYPGAKPIPSSPGLLLRCSSPARIWGGPSRSPGFVLLYSCDLCNEVRMEELAQGSIPGKGREAGMATAASLRGWNGEGEDETLIAGGSGAVPPRPCRGR